MKTQNFEQELLELKYESIAALRQWLASKSQNIERDTIEILDRYFERAVLSVMGIELDGGRLRINGENIIGDWLKKRSTDSVYAWLENHIGELPKLSKTEIADLRAEYKQQLRRHLLELVKDRAKMEAQKQFDEVYATLNFFDVKFKQE